MAVEVTASAEVELPLSVDAAWALLSDSPKMLALDPLLDRYEPENGAVAEGTLNRIRVRIGPFRTWLTTRTELLEPPHRAVFVSVSPRRPVRARTEDSLEPVGGGCRLRSTVTLSPTVPVVGRLSAWVMVRTMIRARRRFLERLRTTVTHGV